MPYSLTHRTLLFEDFIQRASNSSKVNYVYLICVDSRSCYEAGFTHTQSLNVYQGEYYYLRSLGDNPRKDVADFFQDYPKLAGDLNLPHIFPHERKFSSVFRVSSAHLHLWTHYDVSITGTIETII